MKAVLQRVSRAAVAVDGQTMGKIEKGFLIYVLRALQTSSLFML